MRNGCCHAALGNSKSTKRMKSDLIYPIGFFIGVLGGGERTTCACVWEIGDKWFSRCSGSASRILGVIDLVSCLLERRS